MTMLRSPAAILAVLTPLLALLCAWAPTLAPAQEPAAPGQDDQPSVGRWVMLLDEVTMLEINQDGTFVYEDPMEVFSAHYVMDGDEVVCDFSA